MVWMVCGSVVVTSIDFILGAEPAGPYNFESAISTTCQPNVNKIDNASAFFKIEVNFPANGHKKFRSDLTQIRQMFYYRKAMISAHVLPGFL